MMNTKRLVTFALLVFVTASVATLILKENGAGSSRTAKRENASASASGTKLIAYYLHGKIRCVTCNDIEHSAKRPSRRASVPSCGPAAWNGAWSTTKSPATSITPPTSSSPPRASCLRPCVTAAWRRGRASLKSGS